MTYDPGTYWPARYERQGETYVARGGRLSSWERERGWVVPYFGHIPVTGDVLDYGCGPGRFREPLEAHGLTWHGFDIIPGLGTVAEIEPDRYDAVCAIMVLQHIASESEYTATIEALHGALKPGGVLLVVDHIPEPGMDPHMHPRGWRALAELFDDRYVILGQHDGHMVARFER